MRNLTTAQKLEKLYEIMTGLEAELGVLPSINIAPELQAPNIETYFRKLAEQEFRIQAYAQMVEAVGYTALPQIISNEKYAKLDGFNFYYLGQNIKGKELYRGVRDIEHHANFLFDEKYHKGVGDACNGLFSADSYIKANLYSSRNSKHDCVLKFKAPELNIIDDLTLKIDLSKTFNNEEPTVESHKQVLEEIKNFTFAIPSKEHQSGFFYTLLNDPAILAILLGYDAVYDTNFPAYAILNRGKVCVSNSECERIKQATKTLI